MTPTRSEIEAARDRLRANPEFDLHDDLCEKIDVDIGVGVQSSPCGCYERQLRQRASDAADLLDALLKQEPQRYSVSTARPQDDRQPYGMMMPDPKGEWVRYDAATTVREET